MVWGRTQAYGIDVVTNTFLVRVQPEPGTDSAHTFLALGDPAVGKTVLIECLAAQLDAECFFVEDTGAVMPPIYEFQTGRVYPPPDDGVMVIEIPPNSSAERAGLRPGDILKEIYVGDKIHIVTSKRTLEEFIFFEADPYTEGRIVIERDGERIIKEISFSVWTGDISSQGNDAKPFIEP